MDDRSGSGLFGWHRLDHRLVLEDVVNPIAVQAAVRLVRHVPRQFDGGRGDLLDGQVVRMRRHWKGRIKKILIDLHFIHVDSIYE